jgi:hypothetical protein
MNGVIPADKYYQNNAKLEERIAAMLKPETLSADNKYASG